MQVCKKSDSIFQVNSNDKRSGYRIGVQIHHFKVKGPKVKPKAKRRCRVRLPQVSDPTMALSRRKNDLACYQPTAATCYTIK